jgi:hypothetical protein
MSDKELYRQHAMYCQHWAFENLFKADSNAYWHDMFMNEYYRLAEYARRWWQLYYSAVPED